MFLVVVAVISFWMLVRFVVGSVRIRFCCFFSWSVMLKGMRIGWLRVGVFFGITLVIAEVNCGVVRRGCKEIENFNLFFSGRFYLCFWKFLFGLYFF